jgi:hypothetical protein
MFGRRKEQHVPLAESLTNAVMHSVMETTQNNPMMAQIQEQILQSVEAANAPIFPHNCPNCGAIVDPAVVAAEPEPLCQFCREPLPVQHRGYQPMATVGPLSQDARMAAVRGNADLTRVLANGVACRAQVINTVPLPAQVNIAGESITLFVLQASMDGVAPWVVQVGMHVPPDAVRLAVNGANLPAKVIPGEEAVVAIDWPAALERPAGG